jgi:predicted Zn-ribbon and HTH transcriptional regulator
MFIYYEEDDETMKCWSCGYEWEPRTKHPKSCPRCKIYLERANKREAAK